MHTNATPLARYTLHGYTTMMKSRINCLALALGCALSAHAVEGMWQPHQLDALSADVAAKGLQLDPKKLGDLNAFPLNAVVGLGFCTASFVSSTGLVVTNHHCAYSTIQYNSKPERNLIKEGFLAKTIGEELPGEPTARVYVTESITDVSSKIRNGLPGDPRKLFDTVDARQKALVAECEKPGGYRCDVYVFHGGASYFLVKQMEIRDVRLVYAPSEAIGKFGGDTDNWIWPRHTGDFTFIRAYVGPDGKPADYSEANVPYRPKSFLKVSATGVKQDDFVMIAGYPGRTNRYRLAEELNDAATFTYPMGIDRVRKVLNIIAENTANRPDAAIKYAASVAGLNNGLKNSEGNRDGFAKLPVVAQKQAEEAAILAWVKKNMPKAEQSHTKLKAHLADIRSTRERDMWVGAINSTQLFSAARNLYRLSMERQKDNAKRELGFQQRDEVRIEGGLTQMEKRFDAQTDRALLNFYLQNYFALPAEQRIKELDAVLGDPAKLSATLDDLYKSELTKLDARMQLFKADRKAIEASTDPAVRMAVALMPTLLKLEDRVKTNAGKEMQLRPVWMDARLAYAKANGKELYPDANNSLRVTYGNVMGYSPRDAVNYDAFTYLDGIVEKNTGTGEFDATAKQLDAIKAKRFGGYTKGESVPVNYLSDLDITGGNSGSPTLNGKGELVGLAFDGNYEAISSGWVFNPKLTRTIHVDSRYMLWLMQEVDGATNLIKEMEVTR
jgi:hypothetical protein